MQWSSEEMFSWRSTIPPPRGGDDDDDDNNNIEMMDRDDDDDGGDDDTDADIAECESASLAGPPPGIPPPVGSPSSSYSVVGSVAHTLASTALDGVVRAVAHWRVLLLGQFAAFVLAIAGGSNDVLALECGVSAPGTYNAFGYALVGILGAILVRGDMRREKTARRRSAGAGGLGGWASCSVLIVT